MIRRLRDPPSFSGRSPVAVVTGSGGLIGSASVRHFVNEGFDVIGLENDMRSRFFGAEASTRPVSERLVKDCGSSLTSATARASCACSESTLVP